MAGIVAGRGNRDDQLVALGAVLLACWRFFGVDRLGLGALRCAMVSGCSY